MPLYEHMSFFIHSSAPKTHTTACIKQRTQIHPQILTWTATGSSDYTVFSDLGQHGSRYSWPQTRCSWLRERVATRDFGYCLVLAVTTVALLALISANGDKATRLADLEGRFLELTNSSTNLTVLEGRIKALESRNQTKVMNNATDSNKELEKVKTKQIDWAIKKKVIEMMIQYVQVSKFTQR